MKTRVSLSLKTSILHGAGCLMVFLVVVFLPGLVSCKKTSAPIPVPVTPLQTLINSDSSLSFFHRLIIQANETGLLANNSVTLLIPDNNAFRAAGYLQIDSLQAYQANSLVRYLFIPSALNIPIPDSTAYTPYNTLLGSPVYAMSDGHRVWFNGVQAILDTAHTGQALVYRLGQVPPASSDSLNHFLDGDSTLSYLAEAFRRTNLYDSLLLTGSYTLLAPVNSAFQNAGYDSLGAIDSADLGSLIRLLEYHTVTGPYFSNTLMTTSLLNTKEGGVISVSLQNGAPQFMGNGNTTPALLLTGNQVAGKTIVVQRISQLLLP